MKKHHILYLVLALGSTASFGQVQVKKKAEKKANQVLDNLLFGKKKKKSSEGTTTPTNPGSTTSNGSDNELDNYKPSPVDWGTLDMGKVIHFNSLINMLPEQTQGFVRSEKPEGAMYSTQGFTYSTGIKTYQKDGRELTITLSDYLGAEYLVGAQTQGYAYESTDGFMKSLEEGAFRGWVSMNYDGNEGTLMMTKGQRILVTVSTTGTSEGELKSIFRDLDLSQLPSE